MSSASESANERYVGSNTEEFPVKLEGYSTWHHRDGHFVNQLGDPQPPVGVSPGISGMFKFLTDKDVTAPMQISKFDPDASNTTGIRCWWIGHATILIKINDKYIITDPVFDSYASPVPFAVRRVTPLPCRLEDIPNIDYVLISHCHWDHLSKDTIKAIHRRFPDAKFMAPIGVTGIIRSWSVPVVEFDWLTSLSCGELCFYCFPAMHGSARWGSDRNRTLWCSWVIKFGQLLIYFPGDTAVGPHFKQIRSYFGKGVDLMFGPIGPQLPESIMRSVHTDAKDIKEMSDHIEAKQVIPIHYGTFPLGLRPEKSDLEVALDVWKGDERFTVLKVGEKVVWNGSKFE